MPGRVTAVADVGWSRVATALLAFELASFGTRQRLPRRCRVGLGDRCSGDALEACGPFTDLDELAGEAVAFDFETVRDATCNGPENVVAPRTYKLN